MNQSKNVTERYSITTLVVKHLPEFITQSVDLRKKYFVKYKAMDVRFMDSAAMIGFAFLDFRDRDTAEKAYKELSLINFGLYFKKIKVEYAKPDPTRSIYDLEAIPLTLEQQEESVEPISKTLGLLYPPNPHLTYYYPDPTADILTQIMHAVGTVPRLYNQVLHLMNKLNMPPPFGPVDKESKPNLLKRKHNDLLASDESELEDDLEEQENSLEQIKLQEEKVKQARLARLTAEKQKLAIQKTVKSNPTPTTPTIQHPIKFILKSKQQQEIMNQCKPISTLIDLPAFKNYQAGTPSKKLYIKNLSKKSTEEDLFKIYSVFSKDISIQLMKKGKLREQAFITFPDVQTATHALDCTLGYILNDRPMAVHYGRE